MKKMMKDMLNKLKETKGATAVEYALMVALIAAAIITSVTLLGTNVNTKFNNVATTIGSAP
jgi:pilus assembly protein Flp/PilA